MSDILKKHRIIGIRSALRPLKDEGLISQKTNYPAEAVSQLIRLKKKADGATRHRKARTDATIASITKKIEKVFKLPEGAIKLSYPNGRKARKDATIGSLQKKWAVESHF